MQFSILIIIKKNTYIFSTYDVENNYQTEIRHFSYNVVFSYRD